MYASFYNLKESPFQEIVDPKFTWLGEKHLRALSAFRSAVLEKKGFYLLTGNVGSGKSSLIARFLGEIDSNKIVATVTDPDLDPLDFFNFLSDEYKLNVMFKSKGAFLTRFKKFLFDAHQKNTSVILIIEEAHRINQELLEEIWVLSNIEKVEKKLINIFFIGQPEFYNLLKKEHNFAIKKSISVHYHLEPLSEDETVQLILYRLKAAGAKTTIFSPTAFHQIYLFSAGYPRPVVTICDRAMLIGYQKAAPVIDKDIILESAQDLRVDSIEKEKESLENLYHAYRSEVAEAKAPREGDSEIRKLPISDLSARIIPFAGKVLLTGLLILLLVAAGYLIYNFKSVFLSRTSINLAQKNSAGVPSEDSTPNVKKKIKSEPQKPLVLPAGDTKQSPNAQKTQAQIPEGNYGIDNLETASGKIVPSTEIELPSDEPAGTAIVVDDDSELRVYHRHLRRIWDPKDMSPSESSQNVPETFSEQKSSETTQPIAQLSEIEEKIRVAEEEPTISSADSGSDSEVPTKKRSPEYIKPDRLEPLAVENKGIPPKDVSAPAGKVPARQAVAKRSTPQSEALDSASALKTHAQPEPESGVARLGPKTLESDRGKRLGQKKRLESFLKNYCLTYESKDLNRFSALFTADAQENEKPFISLLPKYRNNFNSIDTISYQIELQDHQYDAEQGTFRIEGKFFLKWLPKGANWRQNSGKIFMELQEDGTSYKVSRLDYYGEAR